jgi:ElaB/YqjD/DUF883 family membrane-anchored ribosome-binding protein
VPNYNELTPQQRKHLQTLTKRVDKARDDLAAATRARHEAWVKYVIEDGVSQNAVAAACGVIGQAVNGVIREHREAASRSS